ncbi:hypothetical protein [Streptomyces sp. NRRL S-1022]|uniref:hypothetical protein n=1 Tax=Streptomyces sp. NRRL S-1022 TaxID=1463880 RepID=UPI00131D8268|nr:hypothetical protein [Streptomyces sp. NRRL S-1022]
MEWAIQTGAASSATAGEAAIVVFQEHQLDRKGCNTTPRVGHLAVDACVRCGHAFG